MSKVFNHPLNGGAFNWVGDVVQINSPLIGQIVINIEGILSCFASLLIAGTEMEQKHFETIERIKTIVILTPLSLKCKSSKCCRPSTYKYYSVGYARISLLNSGEVYSEWSKSIRENMRWNCYRQLGKNSKYKDERRDTRGLSDKQDFIHIASKIGEEKEELDHRNSMNTTLTRIFLDAWVVI